MEILVNVLIFAALASVLIVLGLGLYNVARGGDPARSQKLMRLRVLFQLIAVILLVIGFVLFGLNRG